MKRFFVFAFMALVAIGCSSEGEKLSVEEQAEKYITQMKELINDTIDQKAIMMSGGGVEKWYASLDDAQQQEVAQKCQKFTELEKEYTTWRTTLDAEGKKEFEEYAKSGTMRNDMRNVTLMQRLKLLTAPRR